MTNEIQNFESNFTNCRNCMKKYIIVCVYKNKLDKWKRSALSQQLKTKNYKPMYEKSYNWTNFKYSCMNRLRTLIEWMLLCMHVFIKYVIYFSVQEKMHLWKASNWCIEIERKVWIFLALSVLPITWGCKEESNISLYCMCNDKQSMTDN